MKNTSSIPTGRLATVLFAFSLALGLAACGGGNDSAEGELAGTVQIDGSSTVFPITEAVAEEFMREYPNVRVTVGVSGTGGGFSKFLRGETDINDASRPIKESETALAAQSDVAFIELPVAYDGLAVMVNPANDWAACLTVDELKAIWEPGSQVNRWNQVRSSFPDRPLTLYGPGTDSGTYDYFSEAIGGHEGATRSDFTASEDDNVLVQGIAGDANALGFFGLAYYEENADKLKLVGIDDGDASNGQGCVHPSAETVQNGTYQPLSRPVFIYVRASSLEENPAVRAFVDFYLKNAAALVGDVGYVALSDRAYELAAARVQNVTTGSVFEGGSQIGITMEKLLQSEGGGMEPDTMTADSTAAM